MYQLEMKPNVRADLELLCCELLRSASICKRILLRGISPCALADERSLDNSCPFPRRDCEDCKAMPYKTFKAELDKALERGN